MDFDALLAQVRHLLHRQGRVSYRALKLRFQPDDEALPALTDELIYAERVARDEDDRGLVWVSEASTTSGSPGQSSPFFQLEAASAEPRAPEAERRQLTVLFCDLVDSTALASRLDPEEWREVVRVYQEACAKVIGRFAGHIAQYLGDGLLVYFGYPQAHEDDAQRAVRAGLGMVEAVGQLNTRLERERGAQLAVRLGIHTGLVVVGEIGGGAKQEQLALGETPNLAAHLQGLAAPNALVISAVTSQLLGGFFACRSLGTPPLKGITQPLKVYRVLYESTARTRLEAAGSNGLTPLVGREAEVALLRERWAQVAGLGTGPAGTGRRRDCAHAPGPDHLPSHGRGAGPAKAVCHAGRGIRESRADGRRPCRTGRGADGRTQNMRGHARCHTPETIIPSTTLVRNNRKGASPSPHL
jgi:class 3 adenylate cyclase